jgi:hypothetical protein
MRFVVQSHSDPAGRHYDLMLEDGRALATWRIDRLISELAPGEAIDAIELPPHRLAYLSYEGPVSGNRGEVEIALAGEYETVCRGDDEWEFELRNDAGASAGKPARPTEAQAACVGEVARPTQTSCRFTMTRTGPTRWRLQALGAAKRD